MLARLDLLDHQQAIGAALRRQLVVSSALLGELERVLGYPKIATRISPHEARELLDVLRLQAATAVVVSGDSDLLGLADQIPVYTPTAFLALLAQA